MNDSLPGGLQESEVRTCARVLDLLASRPELCDADPRLAALRTHASRLMRSCRKLSERTGRDRDRELLDTSTAIRTPGSDKGNETVDRTPAGRLSAARSCYVCHKRFTRVHFFYDSLCPECAELNHRKRNQSVDLSGKVALVTGGRVKIGHQVVLTLLRWGATVLATTRFPCDAARRFSAQPDFQQWADRLQLFALDLRALHEVEKFAEELRNRLARLDMLINNAAQSVRRPPAWYRDLIEAERPALPDGANRLLAAPIGDRLASLLSQMPLLSDDGAHGHELFPSGQTNAFDVQLDLRETTSWRLELPQVELPELVEVHAVNCMAPFVLLRGLDPLWDRHREGNRFVVNVSSMEGNFTSDTGKTGRHPHTNMAKAAMNMMTRTSSILYAVRKVWMNSVDPGWVSNEAPQGRVEEMARAGFREPIDLVDAAARVLDPVFLGEQGAPEWGKLFKDYRVVPW